VLGVAGRAPSQFDLVADERDHGMIGDATVAWAIVIEDVTQAKLALLHESLSSKWVGLVRRDRSAVG
jgi:hypothetical protein